MGTPLKSVMARTPVVAHVDHPLEEAARRMRDADIGALFVVDGDELVGVITDRDLVVRGLTAPESPSMGPTVMEAMTRHVVSVPEASSIAAVADLMAEQKVRRLAVVNDQRELVGVLSLADVARAPVVTSGRAARTLQALCQESESAKTPAREDPTGGRARGSPPGTLHVYAERPRLRRRPPTDPD